MDSKANKVMIIGMDGCTFSVLDRLITEGKLPNFAFLIKEGVSGNLRSTIPPASAAAWTTFQTGKEPGKHGIFDFFRNSPETYSYIPVNSTFIKAETFWRRLSRLGKTVGVVNFLFTYPPSEVNGFMITGKQTPSEDADYTYPRALKEEILQLEPGYEVEPFKRVAQSEEFLREVPGHLNRQERVNSYLIDKYPADLFMNLFAVPDVIQHPFWRHMDPLHPQYCEKEARKYLPLIENIFRTLDDIVGRRVKRIDENTSLIIMSDHGATGANKVVQLNRWLQDQNLLTLKEGRLTGRSMILRKAWKQMMKLDEFIGRYDRFGLRRRIKLATRERRRLLSKKAFIDWSKTKAYMGRIGEDGIYCNLKGREKYGIVQPGREYEEIREHIISGLRELTDPLTGQRVFKNVHRREDLYEGPFVDYAPDIVLETADFRYQAGDKLFCKDLFEDVKKHEITGKHHPDGILIVYGKGIRKGAKLQEAHICDLAPTILYMMGGKVPTDMDGRILMGLFEEDVLATCPVRYDETEEKLEQDQESEELVFSQEEAEEIEKRLKDLGYL